jgi:gas vesicle protein
LKTLYCLLIPFFVFAFSFQGNAQITSSQGVISNFSIGKVNAMKLFVPKADAKAIEQDFGRWMKSYDSKAEKIKKTEEYIVENAVVPELGEQPVTIYMQTIQATEGVYIVTAVKKGDLFISDASNKSLVDAWNKLVEDRFRLLVYNLVNEEVAEAKKDLDRTRKQYERLQKDEKNHKESIEDCEKSIQENKEALKKNSAEQEETRKEIGKGEAKVSNSEEELKKYKEK